MKKIIFIICLLTATLSFADEVQIPFSCYPKQLQEKFSKAGYKLDLSANDRDENSWGFIESKGSKFSIFTYRSVSKRELNDIQVIVMGDK